MTNYQSSTDEELFKLLFNDDHLAYTEIYDRYSAILYLHAYRRLRHREEAKDLIHEIFTVLWSNRAYLKIKGKPSSYLYRAVRNRIIDLVTRKRLDTIYTDSLEENWELSVDHTDHQTRDKELVKLIELEINALPEKMRMVFNMSRKIHLSHKQIAEELDISELTVRKQINNALKILKPKLSRFLLLVY